MYQRACLHVHPFHGKNIKYSMSKKQGRDRKEKHRRWKDKSAPQRVTESGGRGSTAIRSAQKDRGAVKAKDCLMQSIYESRPCTCRNHYFMKSVVVTGTVCKSANGTESQNAFSNHHVPNSLCTICAHCAFSQRTVLIFYCGYVHFTWREQPSNCCYVGLFSGC